ncbi:hypothetical protein BH748_14045 [Enterococcus casseliflavus]|nr:hypothetical protein BH748_14045 [Enterococcus casseliflavus]
MGFRSNGFIRKLCTKYKKISPEATEPSRLHKATIGLHSLDKRVLQENQVIFPRKRWDLTTKKPATSLKRSQVS